MAGIFYDRLFADAPDTRALFRNDMAEQRRKLMLTLTFIVGHLDRLDVLLPQAVELARRHVGYGARDRHYAAVGSALIEALRGKLGARFTRDAEQAWAAAYRALSAAMIDGARRAA